MTHKESDVSFSQRKIQETFSVNKNKLSCRIQYVEPDGGLLLPDNTISKNDLPFLFDGRDINSLTREKMNELGIVPLNDEERRKLEFLDNPWIHKYFKGDSPARYFLEVTFGKDAILAQYLPPNSVTTKHEHPKETSIVEKYHVIGGNPSLKIGDNDPYDLEPGMSATIPFDTPHPVITGSKPSFLLIVMENAGLVPRKDWHKQV
jgi:hypothetical protein